MVCASIYIPKDKKLFPRGQDANFVCAEAETIGVADGVGGTAKYGIDSGVYARKLMENAAVAAVLLRTKPGRRPVPVNPKRILRSAFRATRARGSSTACILSHRDGVVSWANVGDSGFMLFRGNRMVRRSPTQQKSFNHPYQLGNGREYDRPECAEENAIAVAAGDVLVVGTDGLFDNVFAAQLEEILERCERSSAEGGRLNLEEVAGDMARLALKNSSNTLDESPFAVASKLGGRDHQGGKIDDITVIVAQIVLAAST